VAAVSVSCSGDKSDKEESAGGVRCYGDCGLRLLWSLCVTTVGVTTRNASISLLPARSGQLISHLSATGLLQRRFWWF